MHQYKNNSSNMVRGVVYIGFVIYVMVLATTCCCHPVTSSEVESIARPTRPKTFGSPDELRSYLDQLGQYLAVVSRPRFGKRKPAFTVGSMSTISTPRLQQYIDHQRMFNNILSREDEEAYKLQFKPAAIKNSKDLYDMLFTTRRENSNNDRHQYYLMPQDITNADIGLDSN